MTDGEKPRLIVVAGPNGSGKTSITQQLLMHEWMDGCVYVNPDFIARDEFGDWNAPDAVIQAAQRAAEIREGCLAEGRSLAFETVLSAPDKVDLSARPATPASSPDCFCRYRRSSINAKRVAMRVMEGGHDVPIPKIIGRYTKSLAYCSVVAWLADRTYVYDNSVDDARAKLLFRASKGRLVKVYGEINPWAREITRRLLAVQTEDTA